MLEKTHENPLDCKEIKPVRLIGNRSWIVIGRTDAEAEAEAPVLWPPDAKNWLIWKAPDAGKDWGQEEKGTTEEEVVGWHHRLSGRGLNDLQEISKDREACVLQSVRSQRAGDDWAAEPSRNSKCPSHGEGPGLGLQSDKLHCWMQSEASLLIYLSSDQSMNIGCLFKLNVLLWKDIKWLFQV